MGYFVKIKFDKIIISENDFCRFIFPVFLAVEETFVILIYIHYTYLCNKFLNFN